ncbi:MAG: alkene reductase [Burkholderiaceae bacterium]|nr:MAG: alkene reductase [Burkholderiaceae bacterium]
MHTLFTPFRAGDIALANRIVMAPLTRNRALPGRIPGDLQVEYYRQRASAGLIVTEASQISPEGQGYLDTPGIYSAEQVAGWRRVTDAVHAAGGKIVIQLWHVGRVSHVSLLPEGMVPVSSSARAANTKTFTLKGFEAVSAPRVLRTDEIPRLIAEYRAAARNAIAAGFDGVEVHGANGYLLEQFLRDSLNDRTDAYGGSIANRARLMLEVMDAVAGEIGAGRTGLRLSPVTPANDLGQDSDAQALYGHVVEKLAPMKLAYLHLIEGATGGPRDAVPFDFEALRRTFKAVHPAGAWMVNNGYDRAMALEVVEGGRADLVAFGKPFISNPDLVRRLRENAPLNEPRRETFYGGGAAGYTDYPTLDLANA